MFDPCCKSNISLVSSVFTIHILTSPIPRLCWEKRLKTFSKSIIWTYANLEPQRPLFLKVNPPPKQGRNSNQNKGPHYLGSRTKNISNISRNHFQPGNSFLMTFLGWFFVAISDPNSAGELMTNPTFGDKKGHELNHLVINPFLEKSP